jgi:hypothetical protein
MANGFLFMPTNCLCEPRYRRTQNLLIDDAVVFQAPFSHSISSPPSDNLPTLVNKSNGEIPHVRLRTLPLVPVLSTIISRLPKTYYDCHVMLGGFAANFLCFVTGF